MRARYGSYWHERNELAVRMEYRAKFDTFERRIGEDVRVTIIGRKKADSQADLTTKLNALFTAYQSDYLDFELFLDDDTTQTNRILINSGTFGGVKVINGPNSLDGDGIWGRRVDYANQAAYYIVLGATTRTGDGTYAYKERLLVKGTGAAKWRYSPQISGDPQQQTLQTNTSFWYIQEGMIVGRDAYLSPNPPLYPSIEHGEMREIGYESPQNIVIGDEELFTTRWKYFMEATVSQGFSAFVLPTVT